jgi:hypothetical protein
VSMALNHYDPMAAINPHVDTVYMFNGTLGPIFTVAMGPSEKLLDLIPVLLPDTYKPVRIFSKPNEIMLMDGEARTLWAHSKPLNYPHEQFTLVFKCPEYRTKTHTIPFQYEGTRLSIPYHYTSPSSDWAQSLRPVVARRVSPFLSDRGNVFNSYLGKIKLFMIITNPELRSSFVTGNAQARHRSVFPDEDGRGFSVKFKKLDIEFVFHVKLTAENEEAKLCVPRNLVKEKDLTYHGGNWWRWTPSANFSLQGQLRNDYFVFPRLLISPSDPFEDAVALALLHLEIFADDVWVEL